MALGFASPAALRTSTSPSDGTALMDRAVRVRRYCLCVQEELQSTPMLEPTTRCGRWMVLRLREPVG